RLRREACRGPARAGQDRPADARVSHRVPLRPGRCRRRRARERFRAADVGAAAWACACAAAGTPRAFSAAASAARRWAAACVRQQPGPRPGRPRAGFPSESRVARGKCSRYCAFSMFVDVPIVAVSDETEELRLLALETPFAEGYTTPGQYLKVKLDDK